MTSIAPARVAAPSQAWVLATLSLSMLMPSLDTSIANAGLPVLAHAFSAPFPAVQWIVLAYLLAITSLIVGAGRLGDLVGRRRLLMGGIGVFTAASLMCGAAPSLPVLVAARAAQGLGAAVMMALTVAMVGESVSKERTGSAMGLLGTMSAVGTTLGPSLGGLLIAGFGWHIIFLLNVPLGVLNLWMARRYLPADSQPQTRAGFDLLGTMLLAGSLAAYALAATVRHGHFCAWNGVLLGLAATGALVFLVVEARVKSPLVRPGLLIEPGLAMMALVAAVMMTTLIVGPFYLTRGLGLDPTTGGLVLSVGPLMSALAGVPSGRIVDVTGSRTATIAGLCGVTAGALGLALAPLSWGVAGYVAPILVLTAGYALFQAANTARVMAAVAPDSRGVMSAMLSLARNLGLITGASVMGAVFAGASGASDVALAGRQAVAMGMHVSFAVAAVMAAVALGIAVAGLRRRKSAIR